jgi:hypothetical protein
VILLSIDWHPEDDGNGNGNGNDNDNVRMEGFMGMKCEGLFDREGTC